MKVTSIRSKPSRKHPKAAPLPAHELRDLAQTLEAKLARRGFLTSVSVCNSTSLSISTGMSCFRIDTQKLGHNARIGRFVSSPKGYKRTDVPLWNQRVEFNHILNNVLDAWGLQATIRARGDFVIRTVRNGRINSWNDHANGDYAQNGYGELTTEREARKRLGSDQLEKIARQERNARARDLRLKRKELLERAAYLDICIRPVRSPKDASKIGFHIRNASLNLLENALETAITKGFNTIWTHKSWSTFSKAVRS